MKTVAQSETSSNPKLVGALAVAAVISALGTVGFFVLSGGPEGGGATNIDTAAVPVPPPATPDIAETQDTQTAALPTDPDTPSAPPLQQDAPSFLDILNAPQSRNGAPAESTDLTPSTAQTAAAANNIDPTVSATVGPDPSALAEATQPATDLAVPADNDTQLSEFAAALNEPTEVPGLPEIDPARLVSDVAPTVFFVGDDSALASAPISYNAPQLNTVVFSAYTPSGVPAPLPTLETATGAPAIDTAAPAPAPLNDGPLSAQQVLYSHWDVDMPFTGTTQKLRSADAIVITGVAPTADLSISGEWIAPGVTIYTYNGETLRPETPLSVHVLTSMTIDPDGFARATVRYQPDGGTIDRGLLAVPVVRTIGLADGTLLEARVIDRAWTISVVSVGAGSESTLRTGDRLVGETTTGITFTGHQDISRAFDDLVTRDADTAVFTVRRNGALTNASHALTRDGRGGRDG